MRTDFFKSLDGFCWVCWQSFRRPRAQIFRQYLAQPGPHTHGEGAQACSMVRVEVGRESEASCRLKVGFPVEVDGCLAPCTSFGGLAV